MSDNTGQIVANANAINALETAVAGLQTADKVLVAELDTFYVMWAACLVFLMQCGFATLEAGSIRDKNVRNVLLKNVLDACLGALIWYLIGFGVAGGGTSFIGDEKANYALGGWTREDGDTGAGYSSYGYDWVSFFFSYTFAAAASTIVSGAVAERCQLGAYLVYTAVITAFIYPVVVHWVWATSGWLCAWGSDIKSGIKIDGVAIGNVDFAGSGVVHMTGGVAGLVGAAFLGPRLGRFENPDKFEGHSTVLQVIGTFLLWFGWYGFNGGSTLYLHTYSTTMARVACTTTLSAATSGVMGMIIKKFLPKPMGGSGAYEVGHTCNSILAGLVGITAGCACIDVHASIAVGWLSAWVYHGASCLLRKLKIDDPLDAFPVHGACGFWGVIAVGLFAGKKYTGTDGGVFTGDTDGKLLGVAFLALIVEILWVGIMSAIMFGILKVTKMLRVSKEVEEKGLDISKHGGEAYVNSSTTS